MDPQPTLACFYLGHSNQLRKALENAQGSFAKGLEFNKIHYKCMVGLYEIFVEQKEHKHAYEVVKRLSQYFPANPKRLSEILRLAIINKSYEDVEKYYSVFCTFDERNEELVNYICAALVVCGKYYLQTANRNRALELFQKAAITCAGRIKVLREIVNNLIAFRLAQEAEKFLERVPAAAQSSPDYLLLKFQVLNIAAPVSLVLNFGRELLSKDILSETMCEILVDRALESGNKSFAENVVDKVKGKYPNLVPALQEKLNKASQEVRKVG